MQKSSYHKTILILFLVAISSAAFSQSFEGRLVFKMEVMNPNPKLIPDSSWQKITIKQFGERGYAIQKYFYKNDKYISEIETAKGKGFQAYNPKDKLLYSWQMNSDTAITIDSRKYMDELVEVIDGTDTETILGIPCKTITFKSKLGQTKVWYNSDYLRLDPKLFKEHKYGNWAQTLDKIKCLPLKIEQKGFMTHVIQTVIEFKAEPVNDSQFALPKFSFVMASPIN
ncbi:MAG: hypothetical protein HOP30_13225 [Cyclobacteriaceae bacterium]|nr:hypothetical protein [Cyclobacteriaceae bacterium]